MRNAVHERFIRKPAVMTMTSLGASGLSRLIKAGRFPKPIRLGHRTVVFDLQEVQQWISEQTASR